jgi:hypothetical protein
MADDFLAFCDPTYLEYVGASKVSPYGSSACYRDSFTIYVNTMLPHLCLGLFNTILHVQLILLDLTSLLTSGKVSKSKAIPITVLGGL